MQRIVWTLAKTAAGCLLNVLRIDALTLSNAWACYSANTVECSLVSLACQLPCCLRLRCCLDQLPGCSAGCWLPSAAVCCMSRAGTGPRAWRPVAALHAMGTCRACKARHAFQQIVMCGRAVGHQRLPWSVSPFPHAMLVLV